MKRNFGSLNLAALGANNVECSPAHRFPGMGPGEENQSMDASFSEFNGDENVGLSLEHLDQPRIDMHSVLRIEDMDISDTILESTLTACDHSSIHPPSDSADAHMIHVVHPSVSELPKHLRDQHNVELNALRCLSLKLMLSNLSTSNPTNSANIPVSRTKPSYSYPGVNEHTKTALLPIRHPSLQSV